MPPGSNQDSGSSIVIEKYKYVLDQKKNLNANTFSIMKIYQGIVVLFVVGIYTTLKDHAAGSLPESTASSLLWLAYAALFFCTLISIASITAGTLSWITYRKEEAELERRLGGQLSDPPSLRNFYRWYETYFVIVQLAILLLAAVAVPELTP